MASCARCNQQQSEDGGGYNSDGSRPHTPPLDVGAAHHLRTIVGKLLQLNSTGPKKEKLEYLDKELQFVQQYLSSGRPYPRGEVPSPMTRNNFNFSHCQPNSDTVQSIVKRVLTAGHERENLIKPSQLAVPESVFEPHNKQAQDNLHQVMNSVKNVLHHQPICPKSELGVHLGQSGIDRKQQIKQQVVSSHKSILEGVRRANSQKASQMSDQESLSGQQTPPGAVDAQHMSLRQKEIQDVLSISKQHIEKALQSQYSNKSSVKDTTN